MNYVVTKNKKFFNKIGKYNFCSLSDMKLNLKIAVDTETTGLKCFHTNKGFKGAELFAIQIGTGDNNYLIDLQEGSGIFPNNIMPYLKNRELVFHNAIFDLRFLYKHGLFPKKIKDTFIASKFYYNGNRDGVFRHSFGHVMERELGISYDKSVQKNIAKVQLSNSQAIQYCFNDVDKLLELEQVLAYKINEENGTRSYELQCQSTLPLAYMEMCGMPLSKERWINKINRDKKLLIATEADMLDYIHLNLPKYRDNQLSLFDVEKKVNLNFNSPKQMIEVFKDLELDIINDKGKESLNSKVVKKNKHDFVDIWLTRQKLQKAISTFGYNVLDHLVDGRIYTSFNPMVDTSRISCKSGGVNFLNFPRDPETRKSFLAKEGNIMVGADYSNQEVYCGCDIHHDTVTLQSIKEGICLHCAFAKVLYPELSELTDNEIKKKHADKRQEAKSPRFAFQYGGSAYTIHKNEGISMKRSIEIEKAFKELHSGIYDWGRQKLQESVNQGYVESAGGFKLHLNYYEQFLELKRWYNSLDSEFWDQYKLGKKIIKYFEEKEDPEKFNQVMNKSINKDAVYLYNLNRSKISNYAKKRSEYFKICLNNPSQSTAAHQTKAAMIKLFNIIIKNNDIWKVRIANAPYDEILLEVKKGLETKYAKILEKCMIEEGNKWLNSGLFSMEADSEVGLSWGECH